MVLHTISKWGSFFLFFFTLCNQVSFAFPVKVCQHRLALELLPFHHHKSLTQTQFVDPKALKAHLLHQIESHTATGWCFY